MALDQRVSEAATSSSVSALRTLKHLCTRPANDDKSLTLSIRSAVLGGLVRGRVKRAGGDGKAKQKTTAFVSAEQKFQQQPAETRLDAVSPPTPPPSEDVTAESSPRDAVDIGSLSLDEQGQDQEQEAVAPMARSVSFNEVVKEVLIENRHRTYGNKASRRQHFYSSAELAIFKRTWYWHVKSSSIHWPVDRLLRCGCPGCDRDEGRVPVEETEDREDDLSLWTWEG